jgi:DNA-binding HxlR family transcriptional regulator
MEISDRSKNGICFCPFFGLLDVIAKKWALLIIAILGNEGPDWSEDVVSDA